MPQHLTSASCWLTDRCEWRIIVCLVSFVNFESYTWGKFKIVSCFGESFQLGTRRWKESSEVKPLLEKSQHSDVNVTCFITHIYYNIAYIRYYMCVIYAYIAYIHNIHIYVCVYVAWRPQSCLLKVRRVFSPNGRGGIVFILTSATITFIYKDTCLWCILIDY